MCGIIGFWGRGNCTDFVFQGLKRLEYGGYDSWGMAFKTDSGISCIKKAGKIGKCAVMLPQTNSCIGHSRWATHGKPSKKNAHPHFSCNRDIAVVHNGIIENYSKIRKHLERRGHIFLSETDTEIIPHLIEEHLKTSNIIEAVKKSLNLLQGSFALVIMHKATEGLIVAKKDSPIVIGINNSGFFAASDIPAFIEYTSRVIFLDNDEMAFLSRMPVYLNFVTGKTVKKQERLIEYSKEMAERGAYGHFMLKEIHEQPEIVKKTIGNRIQSNEVFLSELCDLDTSHVKRMVVVACGTSWHAGLIGEFFLEHFAGIPVEVEYASEFRYRKPIIDESTLCIAITQVGRQQTHWQLSGRPRKEEPKLWVLLM